MTKSTKRPKEYTPRICCCIFPKCSDFECKVYKELKAKEEERILVEKNT